MRKRLRAVLLILFVLLIGTQIVSADEGKGLNIYNTRLMTSDKSATFIEGEVAVSCGQSIVLKDGLRAISEKTLPDTGMPSKFKLKVPAKNIKDENVAVLYVQERKDGSSLSKAERVEIEYIERQKQQITTDNSEYELTYPGLDGAIEADATSGENLIYKSSDPAVVEVDDEGNLVAKGGGEAEISIRQIGSSAYEEASQTVKVSVKELDAYTITYHASIDKDEAADTDTGESGAEGSAEGGEEETVIKQIVERGSGQALEANTFENGSHKFLGWATEDGGLREYHDGDVVEDLAEKGENADLYAVWTGDGAAAAIAWAVDIANDDSFTYGKKPAANAIGCYFCGTNCGPVKHNKPKGYEKTYVCLTFVGAAFAHGAEDPEEYYACSHGKMPLYETDKNFTEFSCWTKIGRCKNLSLDDLEPGDVLVNWSDHNDNTGHCCIYIGGNDLVEAGGSGWSARSISVKHDAASKRLKKYAGDSKNYVMRYTGPNA